MKKLSFLFLYICSLCVLLGSCQSQNEDVVKYLQEKHLSKNIEILYMSEKYSTGDYISESGFEKAQSELKKIEDKYKYEKMEGFQIFDKRGDKDAVKNWLVKYVIISVFWYRYIGVLVPFALGSRRGLLAPLAAPLPSVFFIELGLRP